MPFPPVPTAAKREIRRAGETLASGTLSIGQDEQARKLIAQWRAAHLMPLAAAANDLNQVLEDCEVNAIVAQRTKRLFRIAQKLQETPTMNATTMQDIAGLRAIVPSMEEVNRIRDAYQATGVQNSEIHTISDYNDGPKESGYRGVHIALRHRGGIASAYDGMRTELQLRTNAQHLWASAVETVGMFEGQRLKYDEGDPEWILFFALAGELIARSEELRRGYAFADMSDAEVQADLMVVGQQINAIKRMHGIGHELIVIEDTQGKIVEIEPHTKLLLLDPSQNVLRIQAYSDESYDEAHDAYANAEQQVTFEVGSITPVLVAVQSPTQLRDAYRSFYLDIKPFAELIQRLLDNPN